jgi:hypothetical protein
MMISDHVYKRLTIALCIGTLWLAFPVASSAQVISTADLQKFWTQNYSGMPNLPDPYFTTKRLAKAQPDECFTGLGHSDFNTYYPGNMTQQQISDCRTAGGSPKTNQAYVWGLAKHGHDIWIGTVANTLCGVLDQFTAFGVSIPFPLGQTDSWACEFGGKDTRPPRIFVYDISKKRLIDLTNTVLSKGGDDEARLRATVGLRSAGTLGQIVLLGGTKSVGTGGTTVGAVTMFAFDAKTRQFLGSFEFLDANKMPLYTNIRQFRVVDGVLYTGVSKPDGTGAILRWTGNKSEPFKFIVVGDLIADPAYLAVHNKRLFISTWGGEYGPLPLGMLVYMGPDMKDRPLTGADRGKWKVVFKLSDYEVEPAAAQVGGALASFDGYLYFGTMQAPLTGLGMYTQLYSKAPINVQAFLGTQRPITIFRAKHLASSNPVIEVVYGSPVLPKYDPVADSWKLVPNGLGRSPLYGLPGFGNFFNNYTWTMEVFHGNLFVGTMDFLYLAGTIVRGLISDIPPMVTKTADQFYGADLWRFPSSDSPAVPVSISGVGNYTNYGIRTMVADDDALYLGTANPMNMLTDPTKGPLGGWELVKVKTADIDDDDDCGNR